MLYLYKTNFMMYLYKTNFHLLRFGGRLHIDSSKESVIERSAPMVHKGEKLRKLR